MNDEFAALMLQPLAVVMFGSATCQPCVTMEPLLKQVCVAREVPFLKVDVAVDHDLANKYMVRTLPTTFSFFKGAPAGTIYGTARQDDIARALRLPPANPLPRGIQNE